MKITPKKLIKAITPYGLIVFSRIVRSKITNINQVREKNIERSKQFKLLLDEIVPLQKPKTPKLVVSLTTYGDRLHTTAPITVASIMRQSLPADRVVLWLAHGEKPSKNLLKLTKLGLDIKYYDDIKSYKKLIPALKNYPKCYIVTADDDVIYPKDWLEKLQKLSRKYPREIIANRAREISITRQGAILSYNEWPLATGKTEAPKMLPTGVCGIVYPPNSFHHDVINEELFSQLAPYADDMWFWAMSELHGTKRRLQTVGFTDITGFELDSIGLWNTINSEPTEGNDVQFRNILHHYPVLKDKLKVVIPSEGMTGLRIDPKKIESVEQQILFLKHQFAYEYACEIASKINAKSILDFGCGDGYGSELMAKRLKTTYVTGTDIDSNAVRDAAAKYKRKNLDFTTIDTLGKYDVIVSFQVIEHVENVTDYLRQLGSLLNEKGKIILATPDRRHRLNDDQQPWNPFHLREYTKAELHDDIRAVFPKFNLYQLTGDRKMLSIEYSRVAGNRADKTIFGNIYPTAKQFEKKYNLNDFSLSEVDTDDSLDLIALIHT